MLQKDTKTKIKTKNNLNISEWIEHLPLKVATWAPPAPERVSTRHLFSLPPLPYTYGLACGWKCAGKKKDPKLTW